VDDYNRQVPPPPKHAAEKGSRLPLVELPPPPKPEELETGAGADKRTKVLVACWDIAARLFTKKTC